MQNVTGMGCTSTAIIGAFSAINHNAFVSAVHAMAVMGMAGEIAATKAKGPGSFIAAFLDQLYVFDHSSLEGLKYE